MTDSKGQSTPIAEQVSQTVEALRELEGLEFPRPERPVIITVSNQKGGVGKTTTTVNLAAALALGGLRVLVIDIDPQGNASTALSVDHQVGTPGTYDVLVEGLPLIDTLQSCPDISGVTVCPASIDLAGAEVELVDRIGREYLLDGALRDFLALDPDLDVVLIDCPPSLGLLTVNAFAAADQVLMPIQAEYYALEGVSLLWSTVERMRAHLNPRLRIEHILLTMMDRRTRLSADVANEVRAHFPEETFVADIPRTVRVSEAPGFGQTVVTYDPRSPGTVAYRQVALELAHRLAENGAAGGD